jgi:hypothetical protein
LERSGVSLRSHAQGKVDELKVEEGKEVIVTHSRFQRRKSCEREGQIGR